MAHGVDVNSGNTEYFFNLSDNSNRYDVDNGSTRGYTAFGEIIEGLELLDQISQLPVSNKDGLSMLDNVIGVHITHDNRINTFF